MLENPLLLGILISVVSSGITGLIVQQGVVKALLVHVQYLKASTEKAHERIDDHIKSH